MNRFLEGQELIDAVRARLAQIGSPITEEDDAANKLARQLLKEQWDALHADDPDLRLGHAETGVLHECALLVLGLQKRVAGLEAKLKDAGIPLP